MKEKEKKVIAVSIIIFCFFAVFSVVVEVVEKSYRGEAAERQNADVWPLPPATSEEVEMLADREDKSFLILSYWCESVVEKGDSIFIVAKGEPNDLEGYKVLGELPSERLRPGVGFYWAVKKPEDPNG